MKGFFRRFAFAFIFVWGVFQITGCTKEKGAAGNSAPKKYSFYLMMKDGSEYLVQTDTIASGEMHPDASWAKVEPQRIFYELIVKDNHYYRVDWKTGTFVRNELRGNAFKETGAIQLQGKWGVDNYSWLGDTLMVIGYDGKSSKVRFAKINLHDMKVIEGTIPLPAPSNGFNSLSIGFSAFMNDQLYLGYTYHKTGLNSYVTSDTLYVSALTYPGLKIKQTFKDERSTYPGGVNSRQSHFFKDEKGDFYFIACPGIALGDHPSKPTGIFRIKKSDGKLDKDYFFNLSASAIHNHGYGFWYIGEGKAIVRTERKELFTGMQDHYLVPHFDFYLLDLAKQSTSRLPLPLDKGTARNCVLVENGLVYISVNPNKGGNYVWIYNPKTGFLRKGLHFDDQVDYILRMERLNE